MNRKLFFPGKNKLYLILIMIFFLSFHTIFSSPTVNSENEKSPQPPLADHYLELLVKYAVYVPSIWKTDARGGYWGGGIEEKNMNGSVRGTNNIMVTPWK